MLAYTRRLGFEICLAVFIVVVPVDRCQSVAEDEASNAGALPDSIIDGRAELDTGIDAAISILRRCLRETSK